MENSSKYKFINFITCSNCYSILHYGWMHMSMLRLNSKLREVEEGKHTPTSCILFPTRTTFCIKNIIVIMTISIGKWLSTEREREGDWIKTNMSFVCWKHVLNKQCRFEREIFAWMHNFNNRMIYMTKSKDRIIKGRNFCLKNNTLTHSYTHTHSSVISLEKFNGILSLFLTRNFSCFASGRKQNVLIWLYKKRKFS